MYRDAMKAQMSYDFLAIALFVLLVFLIIFEIYILESSQVRIIENRLNAKMIANTVARGINEVMQTNGSSTQVSLPETLDSGESYFLSIKRVGRRLDISWPISSNNISLSVPLLTSNVTELNITKTAGAGFTIIRIINLNGLVNISATMCGNQICNTGENCQNCATDCGACYCGDTLCTTGENCQNCATDCTCYCGDGICSYSAGEDCNNCLNDCGCPPTQTCCDCGSYCGEGSPRYDCTTNCPSLCSCM